MTQAEDIQRRILLVDDEEGIRKVLAISLRDMGYQVLTAADGPGALEQFHLHEPPVVITDVRMPGMDGLELLSRIKAESPDTEVIIITGHGDMDLAVEGLKRQAGDFIPKPIQEDVLEMALQRAEARLALRRQLHAQSCELALYRAEQRFRLLFDEAPCAIALIDADLDIQAANRRFVEGFGREGGALSLRPRPPGSSAEVESPLMLSLGDGEAHQADMEILDTQGTVRALSIWTAVVKTPDGLAEQVLELAVDVTEERRLRSHLASVGLVLASLSHGIKGMLTALDGGVYDLDMGLTKNDRPRVERGWQQVKEMLGRVKTMVLDILYCAKRRERPDTPVDVAQLAREIADVAEAKVRSLGVAFVREVGSDLGQSPLDAGALSAALVNLLENAAEACATDAGKSGHQVTFTVRRQAEELVFQVADNGPGMDQATRQKLFTMFFSTKGSGGTGLGLFVTKQAVEQHGGTIVVASQPGQGTTFTVRLPVAL